MADNGSKLGFGIIGCGVIADFHANALFELSADAEIIGVADVNYDAAEKFANRHRIRAYPDVAALLADKAVDVVCICTPSGYHADVVKQAAEAGKHIVVEKPMAITTEQLDAIVRCCEANGVMLTSIAQSRFSRSVIRTKNAVEEGLLGRIVTADIYMKYFRSQEYYDSGSWRGTKRLDGGGALMNQGIHGVDLLLYLAGPVKRVYARAKTLARKIEVEDTLSAVVDFASGAIGVIQATTSVYPGYPRRLEINGERGSIALEENSIAKWDIYSGSHEDIVVQPAAFSSAARAAAACCAPSAAAAPSAAFGPSTTMTISPFTPRPPAPARSANSSRTSGSGPRTTSSCSFVSSRHTAASRCGKAAASAASAEARRFGLS